MIGIFQGSPEGRANKCQRRASQGNVQKAGQKKGMTSQKQGSLAAMVTPLPLPPLIKMIAGLRLE